MKDCKLIAEVLPNGTVRPYIIRDWALYARITKKRGLRFFVLYNHKTKQVKVLAKAIMERMPLHCRPVVQGIDMIQVKMPYNPALVIRINPNLSLWQRLFG